VDDSFESREVIRDECYPPHRISANVGPESVSVNLGEGVRRWWYGEPAKDCPEQRDRR
jgi:hypothetical protein